MNITLANGTTIETVNVEESYMPRSNRGTMLSIRMNRADDVEGLRAIFIPEATASIRVETGEETVEFSGYTVVDSMRKFYDGEVQYNAIVDLVKAE